MHGAGRLYLFHIALAGLGAGLLVGATALILAGQSFAAPSAQAIADACHAWLSAGAPAALLGLAVAGLALASLGRGLRSVRRQMRASRAYLAAHEPNGESVELDGVRCRLIDSAQPLAFCAGYLRPRVYLSGGALERLDDAELQAVVAHEGHHRRRHDPLRLLAARTLADALFFIPVLSRISERYATLGELAADEAAVKALGDRRPLAAALLKFSESEAGPAAVVSLAPERVDHLLGDPDVIRWRLPGSPLLRSAFALLALAAVSLLVWYGVVHPDMQAPLLMAAACAGMMVCGPIVLALGAILLSRQALRRRLA